MTLMSYFTEPSLKEFLRRSNYWASLNRNQYPVRMYDAITALYNWVDCPCDSNCECKKHGCEKHLVRINSLGFKANYEHYINCYVDEKNIVR